jgi:hypothetical protein
MMDVDDYTQQRLLPMIIRDTDHPGHLRLLLPAPRPKSMKVDPGLVEEWLDRSNTATDIISRVFHELDVSSFNRDDEAVRALCIGWLERVGVLTVD